MLVLPYILPIKMSFFLNQLEALPDFWAMSFLIWLYIIWYMPFDMVEGEEEVE